MANHTELEEFQAFRHDLIIASDDGRIYKIPREEWESEKYAVKHDEFEKDEGWGAIRDVLQYGVCVAAVPPQAQLPEHRWRVRPLGTCYVLNIDALNTQNRFMLEARKELP